MLEPFQELRDEDARAHHLRDHIKDADGKRAQRGHRAHGLGVEAKGEDIGHRIFSGVAQRLGDNEQDGKVRDEKADGIHEAIVAIESDEPRDAEKGRRAHIVACHGDAVLPACDLPVRGEEGIAAAGTACGPPGDQQGDHDEHQKHYQGRAQGSVLLMPRVTLVAISSCRAAALT